MTASDIALCIPAYNAAAFLPRLLASAQAQTIPFSEIWVYDDASTDNTAELAKKFGARVVRGEKNRGCSHGKNILAKATACPWLHFHDADDALKADFVERAIPWTLIQPHRDVVFFSYETLAHEDGRYIGHRSFDDVALRTDPVGYVLAEQINPFCGLYRKEPFLAAGGWDEDPAVLQSEDQAGHLRLALAGLTFAADPAVTVINYIRQGSMTTSNLAGAMRSTFAVMAKALHALRSAEHSKIVARRLWSIAGLSAAYLDWENADRAASLARTISDSGPQDSGLLFRALLPVSPRLALRTREGLIRLLRPSARRGRAYHPQKRAQHG